MAHVEELSEKQFNELIQKPLVAIDFFADWCMPCLMMSPVIEEMAEKFPSIKFAKINVDECQNLSGKFRVMSIPSLLVFKNGKEVERIIGNQPAEAIENKLKKIVK